VRTRVAWSVFLLSSLNALLRVGGRFRVIEVVANTGTEPKLMVVPLVSAAEEQLKEVKAVLVQLQDIFSEEADSGAAT
jgi:hypothetical protein